MIRCFPGSLSAIPGSSLLAPASPFAEQSVEKFTQLPIAQATDGAGEICPAIVDGV